MKRTWRFQHDEWIIFTVSLYVKNPKRCIFDHINLTSWFCPKRTFLTLPSWLPEWDIFGVNVPNLNFFSRWEFCPINPYYEISPFWWWIILSETAQFRDLLRAECSREIIFGLNPPKLIFSFKMKNSTQSPQFRDYSWAHNGYFFPKLLNFGIFLHSETFRIKSPNFLKRCLVSQKNSRYFSTRRGPR